MEIAFALAYLAIGAGRNGRIGHRFDLRPEIWE